MEDPSDRRRVRNNRLAGVLLLLSGAFPVFPDSLGALWPAFVALVMVFVTRSAPLSIGTACLAALILLLIGDREAFLGWFGPGGGLPNTITSPWHYGALLFTLLLGSFAAVLERSGGLLPLLRADGAIDEHTRKRFLTSLFGLGLVCFFDGLANALMLGRVARPIVDRLRIPRAFLAYLVDTTSSAVACLAFLSTWIVTQLGYIANYSPLDQPAYLQFLSSIPHNYYCLFSLLLALLVIRHNWLVGPMRHRPATPLEADREGVAPETGRLFRALVPLLVLLISIPAAVLVLHRSEGSFSQRIQESLNASTVPTAFMIGSALALGSAFACFPRSRFRDARPAALQGARQLLPALFILLLAWILGSLFNVLGTASVLSGALGDWLPLSWLPLGVFLTGCLISFVSGTSWGTMGILMPLVLPLAGEMAAAQEVPPEALATIVPAVIGAVFGGAVFGDHCSPYSDTTIVSALASGVSTHEHTITQLPYALLTAATAVVAGYFLVAVGLPAWAGLLTGSGILTALVFFTGPRLRES